MKKAAIILAVAVIAITFTNAELYMNNILIPQERDPSDFQNALRQLAASFEGEQVSYSALTGTVYIYANGQRIAKIEHNKTFYFHNDHLGSATVVTDEDGNVVEEKKYDPFGVELAGKSKIGYNSKELDKDTELNYYGARYYGAEFGRFITADTVKGKLTNPQSLNLYAYALNNPLKYVDPKGEQATASLREQEGKKVLQIQGTLEWVNAEDARGKVAYASVEFESGDSALLTRRESGYQMGMRGKRGNVGPKEDITIEMAGSQVEKNLRVKMDEAATSGVTPSAAGSPQPTTGYIGKNVLPPVQDQGGSPPRGAFSTDPLQPVTAYLNSKKTVDTSGVASTLRNFALGYVDAVDAVIEVASRVTEREAARVIKAGSIELNKKCGGCR